MIGNKIAQKAQNFNPAEVRDYDLEAKIINYTKRGNYSQSSIARIFKLSRQRVHAIIKRWKEEQGGEI